MDADKPAQDLRRLTANIVAAHLSHNPGPADLLPAVIQSVYAALSNIDMPIALSAALQPAVPIKKSIFPGYIVCLEDGKKMKMLKRHLQTRYGMTPDAYRAKWGLPDTYPMTAPDYAARRVTIAKESGLGRRPVAFAPIELPPAPPELVMPKVPVQKIPAGKRGRKPGSKNVKPIESEAAID